MALDINECKIKRIFARIYEGSPLLKREKAAWIIVNAKGEHEAVNWLRTPQSRKQVWNNPLPANIVAIAHTHPDHTDPKPSEQDKSVAQKMNIPVYTLTRKGIWSVTPANMITQHIGRGWFKKFQETCGKDLEQVLSVWSEELKEQK